MDYNVYSIDRVPDEKIKSIISEKQSFVIEGISRTMMPEAVHNLEKIIEGLGFKCRVYTKGRLASVGMAAIPINPTVFAGWAAGIGIGIHNLVTYNPDYEIAKNYVMGTLTVNYKK